MGINNKPFANVEHDINLIYQIIDGKRPEITSDTPEFFANLMKRCWDSDPLKRPSITEIQETIFQWFDAHYSYCDDFKQAKEYYGDNVNFKEFEQAEEKRIKLIQSKKLGPKFSKKSHPKAVFTSRPLCSLISKASYSSSMITFNTSQGMLHCVIFYIQLNDQIAR